MIGCADRLPSTAESQIETKAADHTPAAPGTVAGADKITAVDDTTEDQTSEQANTSKWTQLFDGQTLDGWVIEPLVQGKATGMDALPVLLVVLAGGSLLGILGVVFLSEPFEPFHAVALALVLGGIWLSERRA